MSDEKHVTTSSTAWRTLNINIVSNYDDDFEIGDRKFDENARCYVKRIKAQIPGDDAFDLYNQLRHIYGDCEEDDCIYCKDEE